jgi:hypothetical protein
MLMAIGLTYLSITMASAFAYRVPPANYAEVMAKRMSAPASQDKEAPPKPKVSRYPPPLPLLLAPHQHRLGRHRTL